MASTSDEPKKPTYTTSSVILASLVNLGITHAFVNWGSDHPALLEDLARQRHESGEREGEEGHELKIVTCPNEMVALSAAQGYAQVSAGFGGAGVGAGGKERQRQRQKIAAVLVHVDVGTQALSCAVHNADRGKVPVFIYAGAAPYTLEGELKGSRNEFIMWLQDVPDQSAIVRQYMRYTAQINGGKNAAQVVRRALQIATSEPKGPVYLWARREATEEDVDEATMDSCKRIGRLGIGSVEPMGLSEHAVHTITSALLTAHHPLIITSYLGRDPHAVPLLVHLASLLAIPVYLSCPWTVSFPRHNSLLAGCSFGMGPNAWLREADVILILDCDVPWIPVHNRPKGDARVFHVDVDVLKTGMGYWDVDVEMRCKSDAEVALGQLVKGVEGSPEFSHTHMNAELNTRIQTRKTSLISNRTALDSTLDNLETTWHPDGTFTVPNLLRVLRDTVPQNTLFLNESISNYPLVWDHLQPDRPGSMIASGSSALGWGLGAAVGAGLAMREDGDGDGDKKTFELTVLVVGDGSFMFGVPSSAFWIARRYDTPFLTIILNNGGWKSPKLSLLGVYPDGHGSRYTGNDLTVGFGPNPPDYVGIAAAAGGAWGRKVSRASELQAAIKEGIRVVLDERRCAVLDCVLEGI